jgi:hypothetical protein
MRTQRKVRSLSHLAGITASAALLAVMMAACGSETTGSLHGPGASGVAPPPGGAQESATSSGGGGLGSGVGSSSSAAAPDGPGPATSSASSSASSEAAPPPPPSLAVMPDDASPTVDLLASTTINLAIPASTYVGTMTLSASGLPSDVTAAFETTSVPLSAQGGTVKLTLTTLSSTVSGLDQFTVVSTIAGGQPASTPIALTVKPVITIDIPVNADGIQGTAQNPNTMAFGAYPIMITAPTDFPVTVNFHNSDSTPHEIHAEQAAEGFPHGAGLIQAGQNDTPRNVTQSGTYDWHLHDEGDATNVGQIVIQ